MWELALVLAASALGCAALVYFLRIAPRSGAPLAERENPRDDVLLALAAAACAFLLAALRGAAHPFDRPALRLGGFLAASIACGAIVTVASREVRRRHPPAADAPFVAFGPASLVHPLLSSFVLGALAAIASLSSRSVGDPAHLAPAIVPLASGFALGALLPSFGKADPQSRDDGAVALETCAAMTVAAHFFEQDAPLLEPAQLRSSALAVTLAPLVLRSLFAATTLAATFAFRRAPGEPDGRALTRSLYLGVVLAVLALAGASFALLGALALPSLFAGAAGATATVIAYELASRQRGLASAFGAFVATALAAAAAVKLLGLTDAKHGALFGVAFAALGARGAAGILDVIARAPVDSGAQSFDDVELERASGARLPSAALGLLLVPLAVAAAATSAACARWAAAGALPMTDGSELSTQCELAGIAGGPATILDPAPLAAALLGVGLSALRPPSQLGTRTAGALVAAVGISICAILGHVLGAGAAGALAACALAAAIAAVVARFSTGDGARRGIGTSGVLVGAMALAFAPMLG